MEINELKKLNKVTEVTLSILYMKEEYDPGFIQRFFTSQTAAACFVNSLLIETDDIDLVCIRFEDWYRDDFKNKEEWIDFLTRNSIYSFEESLEYGFVRKVMPEKWFTATAWEQVDE